MNSSDDSSDTRDEINLWRGPYTVNVKLAQARQDSMYVVREVSVTKNRPSILNSRLFTTIGVPDVGDVVSISDIGIRSV